MIGHSSIMMPNALWAWEGLRRNPDYRQAWYRRPRQGVSRIRLSSGTMLIRVRQRYPDAELFGLSCFADPDGSNGRADVFWRPAVLAGTLPVILKRQEKGCSLQDDDREHMRIRLPHLAMDRTLFETASGARHVRLRCPSVWLQMVCPCPESVGDMGYIAIGIEDAHRMARRLDSALQLLSIHRCEETSDILVGRKRSRQAIRSGLMAYDIWHGFGRPKGGLREIAEAIFTPERVVEDWNGASRYMKEVAVRARNRGERFVQGGYLDLLRRKVL